MQTYQMRASNGLGFRGLGCLLEVRLLAARVDGIMVSILGPHCTIWGLSHK